MQGALDSVKLQDLDTDTDFISDGFSMTDISNPFTVPILISQRPRFLRSFQKACELPTESFLPTSLS